jgi:small subunit ribosomal protein S2
MSKDIDIKELLEAGVHFGHKTSRWHPKMAKYIHSKRQESHIIDLTKTVEALEEALPKISEIVASGKKILIVGTKKQLREIAQAAAESVKQPYVVNRWVGGMLTNTGTMDKQLKKLATLEKRMASGEFERKYNKLEVQRFQEEIDLLNSRYGGIKELSGKPGAVFITDAIVDHNAIKEAKVLGVPVFAITDTNVNPEEIDYVIPANDDAIKSVTLILDHVVDAIKDGQAKIKAPQA